MHENIYHRTSRAEWTVALVESEKCTRHQGARGTRRREVTHVTASVWIGVADSDCEERNWTRVDDERVERQEHGANGCGTEEERTESTRQGRSPRDSQGRSSGYPSIHHCPLIISGRAKLDRVQRTLNAREKIASGGIHSGQKLSTMLSSC